MMKKLNMSELTEDCIAKVLSFTDPREACRLSIVSSDFRRAAQSDTVWERFLPPDYQSILSNSDSASRLRFPSKKQLYLSLCPVLFDNGKRSFWLDKWSGKKCFMISARGLSIIWGDAPQNWRWYNPDTNSRFREAAELVNVWWLEISGRINTRMLSKATNYSSHLVYKLRQGAFGFEHRAVVKLVEDGENENNWRSVYLDGERDGKEVVAKERRDGWLEIELGEFFNDEGEDGELEMRVKEVKRMYWNRGLLIQGMEIRPKLITM